MPSFDRSQCSLTMYRCKAEIRSSKSPSKLNKCLDLCMTEGQKVCVNAHCAGCPVARCMKQDSA